MSKSKIALLIIVFTFIYIVINLKQWREQETFSWDKSCYYLYLPATFIFHDLGHLHFYEAIAKRNNINGGDPWFSIYNEPKTGRKLNKFPIGVSLCTMPFFLVAHAYCSIWLPDQSDGYSDPYRMAIIFATVFWVLVGLFYLRLFLLNYFSDSVTAITLLLIAFGTNLYAYTVFDTGMTHTFSFSFFCMLLYATYQWYKKTKAKYIMLMGFALGMITIIRPTNLIIAAIPLLWQYCLNIKISSQIAFYKKQLLHIIYSFVIFLCVVLIQCGYWKYVTGSWIHDSYEQESYVFSDPHIWDGLFSYRKGWFLYTPIAFIAMLGFIPLFLKQKRLSIVLFSYFVIAIYITFSWYKWWYGGSFGCRALIETYALVAIPLAALIQWIFTVKKRLLTTTMYVVFSFFIALNTFQTYQFHDHFIIRWDGMNKEYYWRVFGKLHVTDEDRKLLEK